MIGWIDFSAEDRALALQILNQGIQPLDELGVGAIRDTFSDLLFPGLTTQQTRAKYFCLIPRLLQELVAHAPLEASTDELLEKLHLEERTLAEQMIKQAERPLGIIGHRSLRSGRWVKIAPSSIYWSGLRRWGIFLGRERSIREYLDEAMDERRMRREAQAFRKGGAYRAPHDDPWDDDLQGAGSMAREPSWHRDFRSERAGWRMEISIQLTRDEAEALVDRISSACRDSLLPYMLSPSLAELLGASYTAFAERLLEEGSLPEQLAETLRLSLEFSTFMGQALGVYKALVEVGEAELNPEDIAPLPLRLEHIFALRSQPLHAIDLETQTFVRRLSEAFALEYSPEKVELVCRLIRERERSLKAEHSRIGRSEQRPISRSELTYRFPTACQLAKDITQALNEPSSPSTSPYVSPRA